MRAYILRYGTKLYWRLRLAKHNVRLTPAVSVQKNISYTHSLRRTHRLDAHYPTRRTGTIPVIVLLHGGGFIMGDKRERRSVARELASAGFVVLNINYGLSPEFRFPKAAIDTLRALEWVATHAADYGGDPQNITLMGDSSGAHIAAIASAATTSKQLRDAWGVNFAITARVKKMVLYYGFYNLRDTKTIRRKYFKTYIKAYTGTTNFEHYKYIDAFSPIDFITVNHPPTLLVASEVDPLYPQTLQFAERLGQKGATCRLLVLSKTDYPTAFHGFIIDTKTPAAKQAFAAVCGFLSE